jgi:tetratricopeptide (TPR) repeat protein
LNEIVSRRPDAFGARTMIGMIQQLEGRPDEAIKTYDAIVTESSRAAVAANNLAYLYADRGEHLDRAVQLAQSAKQHLPENADVSDTLGWVYYKKGMPELAIRPFEFSVQKDPQNPIYLLHLGLAYAKAGMPDKAKVSLTQALKLKPDVAGADEARAVLAALS